MISGQIKDVQYFSSRLIVDLDQIQKNYKELQKRVAPAEAMCVVKADAYGLGASEVVRSIVQVGGKIFFVATFEEALKLREGVEDDFDLYVLEGFSLDSWPLMRDKKIYPVINTCHQLEFLVDVAKKEKKAVKAILQYDTGLSRLGLNDEDIKHLISDSNWMNYIDIQYIISHLACVDKGNIFIEKQGKKVLKLKEKWPQFRYSLLASGGLHLDKKYILEGVRLGLSLYAPPQENDKYIQQAFSLMGQIVQIRHVPLGTPVGYDNTFITKEATKIAVVNIGFADGYMRECTNKTFAGINGRLFPIIGRISMDLTMVDITSSKSGEIKEGDEVEFSGSLVSIHKLPVTPREFMVRLSSRAKRIYKTGCLLDRGSNKPIDYGMET